MRFLTFRLSRTNGVTDAGSIVATAGAALHDDPRTSMPSPPRTDDVPVAARTEVRELDRLERQDVPAVDDAVRKTASIDGPHGRCPFGRRLIRSRRAVPYAVMYRRMVPVTGADQFTSVSPFHVIDPDTVAFL
jgi:hypothetical protein